MPNVTMTVEQKKYIKERLGRLAPSWRPRKAKGNPEEPAKVRAARALVEQYEKAVEKAAGAAKLQERGDFHKLERAVVFAASPDDALKALDAYETKYPKIED
jgi:hypothetical protein